MYAPRGLHHRKPATEPARRHSTLQGSFNPALEGSSVHHPRMTGGDLSLLEHEKGWNTLDPELGRELGFGLDIDLHKAGSRFELLGGRRKDRGHGAAGTTAAHDLLLSRLPAL